METWFGDSGCGDPPKSFAVALAKPAHGGKITHRLIPSTLTLFPSAVTVLCSLLGGISHAKNRLDRRDRISWCFCLGEFRSTGCHSRFAQATHSGSSH